MKMTIKKRLSVVGLSLLLALGVTGCSEGDLKIKVVNNGKTVQDIAILIDDDKVGSSQGGFMTFKVSAGEHIVKLERKNKKYDYTKVYTKKIEVADKSVIESILDIKKLNLTIRMNKTRIESNAKIFKKYNIVGQWSYHASSYKIIFAVSEKGEWTNNYTSKKKFTPNSIIKDDGEGLVFIKGGDTIKADYPVVVDNCFIFTNRENRSKSFKMCKKG